MSETPKKKEGLAVVPQAAAVPASIVLSNAFHWEATNQERAHHSVDKAIEIITNDPRPVDSINLAEWKGSQEAGKYWIRCSKGPPNFYHTAKVPMHSDASFPVLIGVRNGARFLIDGAHRLVRAKMDGRATYPAVFLTEDETIQCTVPGREAQAEEAFAKPFPD